MHNFNSNQIEKFITVTDDWYPCYKNNQVEMILTMNYSKNYHFVRICVWGADDFALEMDYEDTNYEKLVSKYNEWKENIFDKTGDGVNQDYFYNLGFYSI